MTAWERYCIGSNVPPDARVIEFIKCLSKELRTAATHAFLNLLQLDFDMVKRLSKSTAVIPVSICVCCSEAFSCCQKLCKTFRQFSI